MIKASCINSCQYNGNTHICPFADADFCPGDESKCRNLTYRENDHRSLPDYLSSVRTRIIDPSKTVEMILGDTLRIERFRQKLSEPITAGD